MPDCNCTHLHQRDKQRQKEAMEAVEEEQRKQHPKRFASIYILSYCQPTQPPVYITKTGGLHEDRAMAFHFNTRANVKAAVDVRVPVYRKDWFKIEEIQV